MTRKLLIAAAATASEECGYAFHTGFEYRMDPEIKTLPAAWMLPPKLIKTEGRGEGVKHYSVTLNLLAECGEHSAKGKEKTWAELEETASRICNAMRGDKHIIEIKGLECNPAEFTLTNRGELSVSAGFTVLMPFGH